MNFRDYGCKDLDVYVGQKVKITNPPRDECGLVGKIVKIDGLYRSTWPTVFHVSNIKVQFDDNKIVRFCPCELTAEGV